MATMKAAVVRAIEEIREGYPDAQVEEDGEGGAWVIVTDVVYGDIYKPNSGWMGFRITFQYPNADVYPHFASGDLQRVDGRALGEGLTAGSFRGRAAVQLSRRSNRLNAAVDTARLKLIKVLQWLSTHP